ncbi:MarR family transcriptional regulator [Ruminococcus sp. HUN007]|uniref:MarR family winged helix-turn-helix transcriptional regulator n=1 Tax=Ruminococcus sp. HUN007 TaxID=1514668 RepID=UPI0005D149F2|nr:MarR family transcriptional regulator [Ruminococcus sp. HUN007]
MITEAYSNELDRYFTLWCLCKAMYENWSKVYGFSCNETLVLNFVAKSKFCTQKQIAEKLEISKQTVNMILKRFENDGYVELTVNEMDKRSKFIKLTKKGREISDRLIADLLKIEMDSVRELGIDNFRQMNDVQEQYIKLFNKFSHSL